MAKLNGGSNKFDMKHARKCRAQSAMCAS